MSREVVLDMWCSSIPDSMFNDWVTRKLIKKSTHYIAGASKEHAGKFADVFQDPGMGLVKQWLFCNKKPISGIKRFLGM